MTPSGPLPPHRYHTTVTAPGSLQTLDWCVLGGYLLLLGGGLALARRRTTSTRDYFVGHGQVPSWAAAISVLASAMSVATWIGAPDAAYHGDLSYLISNLGAVVAVLVVALVFIPAYYRAQVVTVYDLVGAAYGQSAQRAASASFLLARLLASGARLYCAAIPLAAIFGAGAQDSTGLIVLLILALAAISTVYTLAGGIVGIIWTDVVQFIVTMAGAVAVVTVLLLHLHVGAGTILASLSHAGPNGASKLHLVDWSTDPGKANTVWTALSGYLLFNLAAYGADQDLAQRMLACRSAVAGGRSAILAIVFNLPVVALMMVAGLLLFAVYRLPGLAGPGLLPIPGPHDHPLVTFLMTQMPAGLTGLVFAGLTASAFTSLLSAINAMASAAINDFYKPLVPGRPERHYVLASKLAVAATGASLALVAMLCIVWQRVAHMDLLDFVFFVVTIPYSGLLGVFLGARLSGRGSGTSAIAGLITGMAVCLLQKGLWLQLPQVAWPWALTIGTLASTAVCCASVRPQPSPASEMRP